MTKQNDTIQWPVTIEPKLPGGGMNFEIPKELSDLARSLVDENDEDGCDTLLKVQVRLDALRDLSLNRQAIARGLADAYSSGDMRRCFSLAAVVHMIDEDITRRHERLVDGLLPESLMAAAIAMGGGSNA